MCYDTDSSLHGKVGTFADTTKILLCIVSLIASIEAANTQNLTAFQPSHKWFYLLLVVHVVERCWENEGLNACYLCGVDTTRLAVAGPN